MKNYKIKLTKENREAIKDIANRNGMNEATRFDFTVINGSYYIKDSMFTRGLHKEEKDNSTEITFDQFKQMFDKANDAICNFDLEQLKTHLIASKLGTVSEVVEMLENCNKDLLNSLKGNNLIEKAGLLYDSVYGVKQEAELEKWLRETKAKNLSLLELHTHIINHTATPMGLYNSLKEKLKEANSHTMTKILHDQWNAETPTNGVPFDEEKTKGTADIHIGSETVVGNTFEKGEWKPKRGDRVLVWDDSEEDAEERIFLGYIKGAKRPVQIVMPSDNEQFLTDKPFDVIEYANMKPLPTEEPKTEETDFKSKVIALIEEEIEFKKGALDKAVEQKAYSAVHGISNQVEEAEYLLKLIKELN